MAIIASLSVLLKSDISQFSKTNAKAQKQVKDLKQGVTKAPAGGTKAFGGLSSLIRGDFSGALNMAKGNLGGLTSGLTGSGAAAGGLSSGAIAATAGIAALVIGVAAAGIALYKLTTAAIGAAKAFAGLVREQFAVIDGQGKAADRFGLTVRELTAFTLAAEQSGSSAKGLEGAVRRMNKRLFDAGQGTGEAKTALDQLGLSAQKLNRLPTAERMQTIADAIKGVDNEQARLRITQRIFGDEAADMVNLLEQGSGVFDKYKKEVDSLGTALGREQVANVEKANDSYQLFTEQIRGFAVQIAARVAPLVTRFFTNFRNLLAKFLPAAKQFGNVLFTLGDTIGNIISDLFPGLAKGAGSFAQSLTNALLTLEFNIKNWKEVLALNFLKAELAVTSFALDVAHFFTSVIPTAFVEFGKFTASFFTTFGSNIGNFVSAIVESARTGFTDFKFVWQPLSEGFDEAMKKVSESMVREQSNIELGLGAAIETGEGRLNNKLKEFLAERTKDIFGAGEAAKDKAKEATEFFETDPTANKGSSRTNNAAVAKGSLEAFSIINKAKQNDPQTKLLKEQKAIAQRQTRALEKIERLIERNPIGVAVV